MTRQRQNHTRTAVIVCAILVLILIGSTLALFASRDEVTNRFSGSRFDILLSETNWNPNGGRELVPGDELEKNPQVTNNDRTPGYVFLRVTVPCDVQSVEAADGTEIGTTEAGVPMYKFVVDGKEGSPNLDFSAAQTVRDCWTLVETPVRRNFGTADSPNWQIEYVYAYTCEGKLVSLLEGQTTPTLFDRVRLWNFTEDFNAEQSHSVRIEALGIQADLPGYTTADVAGVWALLNGEGGA